MVVHLHFRVVQRGDALRGLGDQALHLILGARQQGADGPADYRAVERVRAAGDDLVDADHDLRADQHRVDRQMRQPGKRRCG